MRHRKAGRKLGRNSSHRRAVLRNMVTSLFRHEEISTTLAKAKMLQPIADKMITLAKRGDLHARRQALSYMMDKDIAHKLFDELKDRLSERQGGYSRILKAGNRNGDNAPMAIIQLLLISDGKKSKKTTKKDLKTKETKMSEKEPDEKPSSVGKDKKQDDKKEGK
ncbi:MAG: 50S ribosomal protein L17 [Thermodesulfobacteriota bacterium]|nr:50S ribosomal protein L17 [Thermodesulfobacteriota bacterium]